MKIRVFTNQQLLGAAAAQEAGRAMQDAIAQRGACRLIAATGGSQIAFLGALVQLPGIAWDKVELFHLDEYVGLSADHAASFRKYLRDRLITPTGMRRYHLLDGEKNPETICREVGALLTAAPVDLAFAGIGENGHLAFNDPPADFTTEQPYLVVSLDEACRRQQVGEGWFANLDAVPRQAISMSIRQILKAGKIVSVVPDLRKADAVRRCLEGPVSPDAPASILRTHADATVYLDTDSASRLGGQHQIEPPGI